MRYFSIQKSMAVGVMVVAMFFGITGTALRAEAATAAELQIMIAELMAQIVALQGGQSLPTNPTAGSDVGTSCPAFDRTLSVGSRDGSTNGDVTKLQAFLKRTGHYTQASTTGYYGRSTAESVQRWQKANMVVSSGTAATTGYGMVGPTTRTKMRSSCAGLFTPSSLSITAPRIGADYIAGDYVTITWNSKNLKGQTAAVILMGNNTERYLAQHVNLDAGSLRVQIPVSDSLGTVTAGAYDLVVVVIGVKDGSPQSVSARIAIDITAVETVSIGTSTPIGVACMSGSVSYQEGAKLSSIIVDGQTRSIADAYYVCRGGIWKIEGGLPLPVEPVSSVFTTTISGLALTTKFTLNNGCIGYTIAWGDGTETSHVSAPSGSMCTQAIRTVSQIHTYKVAGTYVVTLKRFSGSTPASVETKTITVSSVSPEVALVTPGVNHFACNRTLEDKIANGSLGCYGMWDYGNSFGGDAHMCGEYSGGKVGCVIAAPMCTSGTAKASVYYVGSSIPATKIAVMSNNLKTSSDVVSAEVAGIWEYTCVAPVATSRTGSVRGIATSQVEDVLKDLSGTLQTLLNILK